MSRNNGPAHIVVDGSNIATEGRSMPSLAQLSEAVGSFMEEHPDAAITVVVDATFGHRIDKSEVAEFEAGISNNELVAPPAGAVGRGDAFVLGIADKVGASILSNDSFQEFHGDYGWLFDEGRLIGGKPVPHIGWVFVDRVPVRGPVSRKATRGSGNGGSSRGRSRSRGRGGREDDASVRQGSKEASAPMPTPKSPPPGRKKAAAPKKAASKKTAEQVDTSSSGSPKRAPRGGEPVNELMPFLDFVEQHPVGTSVTGTVDAYSSHGAYVTIGDTEVRGYVPLSMMADPAPRSAKKIMRQGESVTLVVVSFAPARRSIDCAVPDMADAAIAEAALSEAADGVDSPTPTADASTAPARKETPAKKRAAAKKGVARKKSAAKKAAAKKATVKKATVKKATVKKAAAKKSAVRKTVAKKATAKKATAKKVAAKKPASKQAAAKKTPAKKTPAKKSAAKKTPAKKTAAGKRAGAKRAAAKDAT